MYKRILHATDLSENHFDLCEQAAKLAQHFKAKLFLLHVIEPPTSVQISQGLGFSAVENPTKENAQVVLNVVGDAINVPVKQQFVEIGSIKTHVLEKAEELDCQLIILGKRAEHNIPAFLDDTAHLILQEATCDVLTLSGNVI